MTGTERVAQYVTDEPGRNIKDVAIFLGVQPDRAIVILNRAVELGMVERWTVTRVRNHSAQATVTSERYDGKWPVKNVRYYYFPPGTTQPDVEAAWRLRFHPEPVNV